MPPRSQRRRFIYFLAIPSLLYLTGKQFSPSHADDSDSDSDRHVMLNGNKLVSWTSLCLTGRSNN